MCVTSDVSITMTKFPASVMVLEVVSSEGHVRPPVFNDEGIKDNADVYVGLLEEHPHHPRL